MKQGTQEWLDVRKSYIGASDAPCVMGVGFKTPLQLWEQKVGLKEDEPENYAMRYGKAMEPIARKAYEKHTNNLVTPEVIFHPQHKFMMASLDGINFNGDVILEIKCTNEEDHNLAKKGKIPEKYWPQLQHQLDCCPEAVLHYWSFHKECGVLVEVNREEGYIKDLISKESEFWEKVQTFDPPSLSEKDYTHISSPEWNSLELERIEIDKMKKQLKKRDEENKLSLLKISEGQSALGRRIKLTVYHEKGRVDYSSIPELENVDLDAYRKKPTKKVRLTVGV